MKQEIIKVQIVKILSEQNQGKTVNEICRSQLSAYKVPKEILFVNELPKTAVGKILKRNLIKQFNSQSEQV